MTQRPIILLACVLSTQILVAQVALKAGHATKRFRSLLQSKQDGDSLQLVVAVKDAAAFMEQYRANIIGSHTPSQTFVVTLLKSRALHLLSDTNVMFTDTRRAPKEELTTGSLDISVNNISFMHHRYPSFKGQGIRTSVKEQQFDSTDIDFKGRYFNSGVASATGSTHASIMATMLGGAGNTTVKATGAAPGVQLTSSSFALLLPDADAVYQQHHISVQNHSYGTDIENFYGADARAYDISVLQNPALVHVFSTGNKGTAAPTEGAYAGIEGMANLTGSFKMAKNIITVGAVDSFNNVVALSSKGPAYDGRIKPEIVAYGLDGSSGAAALVSGTAAVLQQAYQSIYGRLPSAALIKAVLVNSADDKGAAQVDYAYGFGSLNAYKALTTILQQRIFTDSIAKREIRRFGIAVPEGIAQLKITLAWTDTAAAVNAAKALVNDLDAELHFSSQSWQPWILNHAADINALRQPAVRERDTLNNVEQFTIENPAAGNYAFIVDGSKIQTSGQAFAIAYQLDTAQMFTFTFPTASDALPASTSQLIKWQTTIAGEAVLEYATNDNNWQAIHPSADLQKGIERFVVPNITGKIVLRTHIPSQNLTFLSDTVVVTPELNMKVGLNCTDSFMLYWNNATAADYQLYRLGEKYMEPFRTETDTFSVFNKASNTPLYYAVAPQVAGQSGYRSQAINYTTQGVDCYLYTFYAFKEVDHVRLDLQLGTVYHVQKIEYQVMNSQNGFETFFTIGAPTEISLQGIHANLKNGINLYRAAITTASGAVVYTGVETIYHFTGQPVIVYPNPARQGEAVRILAQDIDSYSIQVLDATGRTLFTQKLEDYSLSIPPLRLSKGVYFIKVWSDDKTFKTQKIIVY